MWMLAEGAAAAASVVSFLESPPSTLAEAGFSSASWLLAATSSTCQNTVHNEKKETLADLRKESGMCRCSAACVASGQHRRKVNESVCVSNQLLA